MEDCSLQEVDLSEQSDHTLVISAVMTICCNLGFNHVMQAMISSAASELSTNILKYAGTGKIIIKELYEEGLNGIEINAIDNGPGIDDIDRALSGTYSSGGTLGLGLCSVKRIMDDMKIESSRGIGTRIQAKKWLY